MSVMALVGATGVAQADEDSSPPSVPDTDQPVPELPLLFANLSNQHIPPLNWDGAGMYCQNLQVTCG
jgi:hypothetical protein